MVMNFFIIANVSVFLEKGDIPMNEQYESQTQITYYQKKSKALKHANLFLK